MEKIILPEGWEIDREKSSDNEIVIRKVEEKKALTWLEIQRYNFEGQIVQYYINLHSNIVKVDALKSCIGDQRNHIPSERIAEKIIALSQMYVIADYCNREFANGWVADWMNLSQRKYYLEWCNDYNTPSIKESISDSGINVYFASAQLAGIAYENNETIFKIALKP